MSPWSVLERQAAHSFEMATLLASLLIGADYDAYVVSGYATREVCNNDQLRVVCPDLIPRLEVDDDDDPGGAHRVRLARRDGAQSDTSSSLAVFNKSFIFLRKTRGWPGGAVLGVGASRGGSCSTTES